MEDDVAQALAYQVKKDLAERYFGFRKLIEEDTALYFQRIKELDQKLHNTVGRELVRLYLLLRDDDLIEEFFSLTGLPKILYFDDYLVKSANIRRRLFQKLKPKGWTAKGRFKRLLLDTYERLWQAVEDYREELAKLRLDSEIINQEIERFREKFDLSEIMQFLKGLEFPSDLASLGHTSMEKSVSTLEKTLEFQKVPPPEAFLPDLPSLPTPEEIQKVLSKLAKKALSRHQQETKILLEDAQS